MSGGSGRHRLARFPGARKGRTALLTGRSSNPQSGAQTERLLQREMQAGLLLPENNGALQPHRNTTVMDGKKKIITEAVFHLKFEVQTPKKEKPLKENVKCNFLEG